jgi:hypothetical protein
MAKLQEDFNAQVFFPTIILPQLHTFLHQQLYRSQVFQVDKSNIVEKEPMDVDEDLSCGFCGVSWGEASSSGD